jgi:hypothetical protein
MFSENAPNRIPTAFRTAPRELETGSDRVIAVVAGAIIDSSLTDVLKKELNRDGSDYTREIQGHVFRPDGPLGNLGAKIWMAYLLGYFTHQAHDDLQNFAKIRNFFAHYSEHNSFETQKIKDRCANFKLVDQRINPPTATVTYPTGTKEHIDCLAGGPLGFTLNLANFEEATKTSKGRFIATAKLFCAAFEFFLTEEPPNLRKEKPVL